MQICFPNKTSMDEFQNVTFFLEFLTFSLSYKHIDWLGKKPDTLQRKVNVTK